MTISLARVHHAAFWGEAICLTCGHQDDLEDGEKSPAICTACHEQTLWDGEELLNLLEQVKPEEEEKS